VRRALLGLLVACRATPAAQEPAPAAAPSIHVELDGDRAMRAGLADGFAADPAFAVDARPPGVDGFRVVGKVESVEAFPRVDGSALIVCEASIVVTTEPDGAMIASQRSSARVETGGSEATAGQARCVRSLARFLVDDELRPLLHQRMLDR
jgi:hypothetical protein